MENLLVHFALAKTFYSEKKNYLETFAPFVLDILASQDKVLSIKDVSEILSNSYQLTIPFHTIQSIIRHLNNKQLIEVTDNNKANIKFIISEKGTREFWDFQTNEDDVSRKLNKLFVEFNMFVYNKHQVKYELSYVQAEIIRFIRKNLPKLAIFAMNDFEGENGDLSEFDLHCIEFIGEIEQHEPELFTTFNELLRGSILWSEIRKENLNPTEKAFENITIYLDTNFVLSLLELHHPTTNAAAKQLFELLKSNNKITLQVFNITLNEICRLLDAYKRNKNNYSRLQVYHIFFFLKEKGYDDAKIDLLKGDLESILGNKLGIGVSKIDLMDTNNTIYQDLYSYMNKNTQKEPDALHYSCLHDATIINKISSKRGAWVAEFEKCKYIFLTSSYWLDKFAKQRHGNSNNFSETILDLTLTNILWLKNPNSELGLSVHHLLAVHSKRLLVDNNIWQKFNKSLKELYKEGKIDENDYARLISKNQITIEFLTSKNHSSFDENSILDLSEQIEESNLHKEQTIVAKETEVQEKSKELQEVKEMLSEFMKNSEENVSQLKNEIKQTKDEVRQQEIVKLKEIEKKDIESKKNVLIAEIKQLTERIDDITEQKVKAEIEFEKSKRKFGFQMYNFLGLADEQKLFEKISQKYYSQPKLETLQKELLLKQAEINQIEINNFSLLGKTVILCENQNFTHYNNIEIDNHTFVPHFNCERLFYAIRANVDIKGLRDRDFMTEIEIDKLEKMFPNYFILRFYAFENYIYHPDNLSEIQLENFDRDVYINEIIKLKNEKLNDILPNISSSRQNIHEFKIDSEKIKQKEAGPIITADLRSDEFERFYKYYSIKEKGFKPEYLIKNKAYMKLQSPEIQLSKTKWFAAQIKSVLRLD